MIEPGYIILAVVVIFIIGFIIGLYNWQIHNSGKDKTRHSIGLGIGVVIMFIALLSGVALPTIKKSDPVVLPISQPLNWSTQDAT